MKKARYKLLVVAHPDDESIFFSGLLLRKAKQPWKLICATDGNADGRGMERAEELRAAARVLGIRELEHWNYPDIYEKRLPVEEITRRLREAPEPEEVYTHGPFGEYGHPHHQDVSAAVHRAFPKKKVFSPAYNVAPDFSLLLTDAELKKKQKIFGDIYRKETLRFANIIPCTSTESFARLTQGEVEALYAFCCGGELPEEKQLKKFRWLREHLLALREQTRQRRF